MPIALALASALTFGLADFLAGLLSRRLHYALVGVLGNASAVVLVLSALALSGPAAPGPSAIAWGLAAGAGTAFGTLMLYRGLAEGRMGVVAPLSALGAAVLPVIVGVVVGDRPALLGWVGVAAAVPAIWLVSTSDEPAAPSAAPAGLSPGVIEGLLAGVGFALLFIGLNLAGDEAGLWPLAISETSSLVAMAVVVAVTVGAGAVAEGSARVAGGSIVVGLMGGLALIAYFFATHAGLLSIVAVVASLYPAVTVLLAALLLHESISRRQAVGLVLAAISIMAIVAG